MNPSRQNQARFPWLHWGAIAVIVLTLLNILLWPGPDGIALVNIGKPKQPLQIEATLLGINADDATRIFQVGKKLKATLNKTNTTTLILADVQELPSTIAATQRNGTVKALADPRPEMRFSKNLLLKFKVMGYANNNGIYVGLKAVRVGSTLKIVGDDYETQATVISAIAEGH